MARCNKTYFVILGFLIEKEMSGYDIIQTLKRTSHWYWAEGNAQIYPMLKKLEINGDVSSKVCHESGERQRRCYKITQQGRLKLIEWLQQPVERSTYREELLLKLKFATHTDLSVIQRHIEEFSNYINMKLTDLNKIQHNINTNDINPTDQAFKQMTFDYINDIWQAKAKWAEKTQKKIATLRKKDEP